ncbi:type IV pilus modification PilV family protein [Pseudoalteromonas ruthenica]|uniref:Agglutinin biogenesis protein MshD n=1 Tax=Pseudoalteromonas ruthenica TaxID=151081 RepID=A0A0F4PRB6_9GAMM|nr:prepilin-type N-terminal cleavage/methylation domain-containing protein [Pseudoalteromonas ruthenica]KJY97674.1 agglutinin biogenesis protein MshD [Pseudoalteromonas ruthenica]KJZ01701.1 agglutinin biogenesis protein MshD [Pseudoalteromonas ruthenica]TMO89062.1 type II secretion system protein [Pseudoalteromonas ruthenica]TMO94904.1 type II secretion system protein [Pseudoalteromonas ruthenica]TMO97071.1 type II secretion system protein [Pseudoalteromonas ruthenica]
MAVKRPRARGFTLVELILGIVIFAIAMVIVFTLIAPQARQSAEPLVQVKAAKLGQSLMNEILGKAYDENSDRSPPFQRCDEKPVGCSTTMGPEEGSRDLYDDVDDYNGLSITDVGGTYSGFAASVLVAIDGDYDQSSYDNIEQAKRIEVTITAPNGERYRFDAYRGNY